jgi:acyl-coenzyme A synthetase/AMP-(fatty) acid ligase
VTFLDDPVAPPHRWVLDHARRDPRAPAIATPATRLDYGQLRDRSLGLAAALASAGVEPGDRVVLALPNSPATIIGGLAIGALGAVSVEVDRAWDPEVLRDIVTRTKARVVLLSSRDTRRWSAVLPGTGVQDVWVVHPGRLDDGIETEVGSPSVHLMAEDGVDLERQRPITSPHQPDPDEVALILFTSGTSGTPQGVLQTVRNLDANTRSIVRYLGLEAHDRAMLTLPLFYCYGRSVLQTHLAVGGSVVLDHRFVFPRVVMEAIGVERCTGFAGVPLTFEVLRRQVEVAGVAMPDLRYVTQAGGAMSLDTTDWVRSAFAPAELIVMYGQTEATARLAWLPPQRASDKRGSMGIAIPGVELRVVDDSGTEQPRGVVGHLIARGDNVTPGYMDDPAATTDIIRDGWLWTGDLATQDEDGFLFHRGREREIIKVGGHRVSPGAIEQLLEGHVDVAEAGVCGVPDELLGEVPVAFIVPAVSVPAISAIRDLCRSRLPPTQVPRWFRVVASLPRNTSGKLLRPRLRAMAMQDGVEGEGDA